LLQRTFKNLPLKLLYDCWKSENNAFPTIPLNETHNWQPKRLALKKYKKTFTDGKRPKCVQRMEKPRTNAQLFGCSWDNVDFGKELFFKIIQGKADEDIQTKGHSEEELDQAIPDP